MKGYKTKAITPSCLGPSNGTIKYLALSLEDTQNLVSLSSSFGSHRSHNPQAHTYLVGSTLQETFPQWHSFASRGHGRVERVAYASE
jgi:hypothetical protein